MGKVKTYPWTKARISDLGAGTVTHSFLVMPECPHPLLGRDFLHKLRATISFEEDGPKVLLGEGQILSVTLPLGEEYRLHEERPPHLLIRTYYRSIGQKSLRYGQRLIPQDWLSIGRLS